MNASLSVFADSTLLTEEGPRERWLAVDVAAPVQDPSARAASTKVVFVLDATLDPRIVFAIGNALGGISSDWKLLTSEAHSRPSSARHLKRLKVRGVQPAAHIGLRNAWTLAADDLRAQLKPDEYGHCVLITHGADLRAMIGTDEAAKQAARLREDRIMTSVLVTENAERSLLERLANAGGGALCELGGDPFRIDDPGIRSVLDTMASTPFHVVAQDASLLIEAPAGVQLTTLPEHTLIRGTSAHELNLSDLCFGQTRRIAIRTDWPRHVSEGALRFSLRGAAKARPVALAFESGDAEASLNASAIDRLAPLLTDHARSEAGFLKTVSRTADAGRKLRETLVYLYTSTQSPDAWSPIVKRCVDELAADLYMLPGTTSAKATSDLEPQPFYRVHCFTTNDAIDEVVRGAAELLQAEGLPKIEIDIERLPAPEVRRFTQATESLYLSQLPQKDGRLRLVFVDTYLTGNWFLRWHTEYDAAVSSFAGWAKLSTVSNRALAAHFLVKCALRSRVPEFDPLAGMHLDTRGCWGDFCMDRSEYELKLQTGELCDECRDYLSSFGFDLAELFLFIDAIREAALSESPPSRLNSSTLPK